MGQKRCSICGKEMLGYGHNAQPINDGRCCDACDDLYVFPMRIAKSMGNEELAQIVQEHVDAIRK